MMLQNPNFYVFGYNWMLQIVEVFIFSKNQSLVVLTPFVALSCLLRHLVLYMAKVQSKQNVIISKSKFLFKNEMVDFMQIVILSFKFHYILISSWCVVFFKEIWKTSIWDTTLVHLIMFSPHNQLYQWVSQLMTISKCHI